jgi:acyl-CoA synthetase (AMP-forming)/AMP-acid ligase II
VLLLEKNNFLDKNIFLLAEDKALTYEEVFRAGDELFDNDSKELVLILCDKDVDTIITYVGALRHNKVPLLIDRNYKAGLINSFIENYSPSYIFASEETLLDQNEYGVYRKVLGSIVYKRKNPVSYEIAADLALMIPTSGSTGDPKSVRFSSNNIDSCTKSICEYLDFDQDRVAISFLPIHYSYGLSVLHNCIYKRAKYALSKLTILDKELWNDIEKYQVTDFSGVPFSMKILRRMKLDYDKVSSLKYVTQAGGYLPEVDSRYFFKEFAEHSIRYFTMYGQTEASPRISYLAP